MATSAGSYKPSAGSDGTFRPSESSFRKWVSPELDAEYPVEAGRYVLFVNRGCPYANRTTIAHSLKRLQSIVELSICGVQLTQDRGWLFDGEHGSDPVDRFYGFKNMKEVYMKADPSYAGRFTVPVLWDKRHETIVSNESGDIVRMFATAFDALLPEEVREANKAKNGGGLRPDDLAKEVDEMNDWVHMDLNTGVYRTGFARTQEGYDQSAKAVFAALDRLEEHLKQRGTTYLFADHITETDIRLFPTLLRFDIAYVFIFRCNLKQIRYDYPLLHKYLRRLYWEVDDDVKGAFRSNVHFDAIKIGYGKSPGSTGIVPIGPAHLILPLDA